MDALRAEGVVVHDTLGFVETVGRDSTLMLVQLDGFVFTASGGMLETHKRLSVEYDRRGTARVRTTEYVHMALLGSGSNAQPLFRYDNSHGDTGTLHRHHFDHEGTAAGQSEVAHDRMPYMDDVIRETEWLAAYLTNLRSN